MQSIEQQLSRIDLNLLVAFSVLLQENNVSRAAEKLFMSQSAMSRVLQKLRELFDDPLFLRESSGLKPTVKALELAKGIEPLIDSINSYIQNEPFDPLKCQSTFSISVPPLMIPSLMLPFISELATLAPNIVIEIHPSTSQPEKHLENGMFDFSIGTESIQQASYSSTEFATMHPVIYARKNHPLTLQKSVLIDDCLAYKYVDLVVDNHAKIRVVNPGKMYFYERGIELEVALKCGQLAVLAEVMKKTDHLLIGSNCLMNAESLNNEFVVVYAFEEPSYQVGGWLNDHQRTHNSEAHQWLKSVLLDSLRKTMSEAS